MGNCKYFNQFCLLLVFSASCFCNRAYAENDGQVWTALNYTYYKADKVKASVYAETRFSDDQSGLYAYFIGPTVALTLTDHWKLGAAYKSINLKRGDDFEDLYRFELDATYSAKITDDFKFDFRNRYESIHEDGREDKTRYRSRFQLKKTIHGSTRIKSIFFSEEILYSKSNGSYHLDQSRLIPFGVNMLVGDDTSVSLYYMYQFKNNSLEDDNVHIFGATVLF